ncbi:Lipoma-preferred partner like protein [Chelonia mydas]|uniref:Lipoma-preferred partner like protein n=1 Tax=Chelonia mydas TaxID=8469 RepID=M7BKB5_CHEMY|nr:Lipoma-preferred partner like protein [Chelonia mydas]
MSHPSWLPPKNTNEPVGHVTARMETTHAFGTPSISVSTQQMPKKFAPVVAPKPKYNPYKQPGSDAATVVLTTAYRYRREMANAIVLNQLGNSFAF